MARKIPLMNNKNKVKIITLFEHQSLKINGQHPTFKPVHLTALQKFYGEKGVPYFKLIHNGVKFCEYVGVLQIAGLVIEVLPKSDNQDEKKYKWRKLLIRMLQAVGAFNIHAPSTAALSVKPNFILDLYFELFIKELELLFHKGLIKRYRKKEGNQTALKGSLHFAKQLQYNIIHQERFFVRHNSYDKKHKLHQILYKALGLLKRINTNVQLNSRIGRMLLDFPEMADCKVTAADFNQIVFDRKNKAYKNALQIAQLLLLNYHPDLMSGNQNILALMFDMNLLWERFIYISLRKLVSEEKEVLGQNSTNFWKSLTSNNQSTIRPDIIIKNEDNSCVVIDTKWKNIGNSNPSINDLRQLYVYHEYFNAKKVILVYPGNNKNTMGEYYPTKLSTDEKKICSIIFIAIPDNIDILTWQQQIVEEFS